MIFCGFYQCLCVLQYCQVQTYMSKVCLVSMCFLYHRAVQGLLSFWKACS